MYLTVLHTVYNYGIIRYFRFRDGVLFYNYSTFCFSSKRVLIIFPFFYSSSEVFLWVCACVFLIKQASSEVDDGWQKGSPRRAGFEALLRSAPRAVGSHLGQVMPVFRELLYDARRLASQYLTL